MKAQEEHRQGDLKKEARETRQREKTLRQLPARTRERKGSAAIGSWELQGIFLAPPGLAENLQGMAGPDSSTRQRRLLQGMIYSWQQDFDREREAMRDEDLQREEIHKGNRYLLEERDAPRLELIRGVGGGLQREPEITPTLMPRKENKKGKVSSP